MLGHGIAGKLFLAGWLAVSAAGGAAMAAHHERINWYLGDRTAATELALAKLGHKAGAGHVARAVRGIDWPGGDSTPPAGDHRFARIREAPEAAPSPRGHPAAERTFGPPRGSPLRNPLRYSIDSLERVGDALDSAAG